jgi:hypothetical protein
VHQKRYGDSTIRNIPINFKHLCQKKKSKLPFKKSSLIYECVGSFLQIRENHIEGHGQLEDNTAPPI